MKIALAREHRKTLEAVIAQARVYTDFNWAILPHLVPVE